MEQQENASRNQPMVNGSGATNGNSPDTNSNSNLNNNQDSMNAANQQQNLQEGQQEEQRAIPTTQEVHTREKLFDFIALLQGRRMDDQRAILKPSRTST